MIKKHLFLLIVVSLALLLATSCVSQSEYDNLKTQLQNTQSELNVAQDNLTSLNNTLQTTQSTLQTTKDQLTSLQRNVDNLTKQLKTTQESLSSTQASLKLYRDTLGAKVYSEIKPAYYSEVTNPLVLYRNTSATNPTWQQLQTFLSQDKTDQKTYIPNVYMCCDYAKELFNNAEAVGIRAAFVAIHFSDNSEPHALNAFVTQDKGLVYIDCTGQDINSPPPILSPSVTIIGLAHSWDKVAYVQVGKPFALISLGTNYGTSYSDYQKWQQDEQLFDSKLKAYNNQLGARYYVNEPEYSDLMRQKADLDKLARQLGAFWEQGGIVSSIEIYW